VGACRELYAANGEPPKPDEKQEPPQGGAQSPDKAAAPKKPEQPKDPNLEVLADLLEGKRRAIVQIDSAADLLHWQTAVADTVKFPRAVAVPAHDLSAGTVDVVLEQLKSLQCPVLLPPNLATMPRTRYLTHPAKLLHDAGIEIGFALGDNPQTVRYLFFRLMELVRSGLPADVALRAVTLVPAKILGIDKRTGSLEVGKDADLLVFRGDPMSPAGELESVWLDGREVPKP
jgi:imidazolonepropionase-like amidohydrolase